MDSQADFFEDLPRKANPRRAFAEVRVDGNILPFPVSIWKGGRMRGDLSAYDAGEVVSRNTDLFWKEVIRRLREKFNADIVELVNANIAAVVFEVSQELTHPASLVRSRSHRLRKRDLRLAASTGVYANPFADNADRRFGKYPDWLLSVPDKHLKPQEKLIYGRLLFPLPPICNKFRKDTGEIVGLNQGEVAKALGMSRPTVNHWLIALQAKRCIECIGASGAKQITRFIYKEWMPETCRTCRQVSGGNLSAGLAQPVGHVDKQPVGTSGETCGAYQQVSDVIEKRELREKRESSKSLLPVRHARSRYDGPDW